MLEVPGWLRKRGLVQREGSDGHSWDVTVSEAEQVVAPAARVVPDSVLWAAACAGDGESFAVLYDRHGPRVSWFLARRVGAGAAEDLLAEVFLQAWRQRDRIVIHEDAGLFPWLVGVARNLALGAQRGLDRDARLERLVPAPGDEPDLAERVVDRAETAYLSGLARRALESLGDEDREVLEMCVLAEITPSAASPILGQQPSTVRSRLTRARRRLSAAFDALVAEGGEGHE